MSSQQGLSLFEVIIALVMVSIALTGMLDGMGAIIQTRSYLSHHTLAQEVAWQSWMASRAGGVVDSRWLEEKQNYAEHSWQVHQQVEATNFPRTQSLTISVTPLPEKESTIKLSALVVTP